MVGFYEGGKVTAPRSAPVKRMFARTIFVVSFLMNIREALIRIPKDSVYLGTACVNGILLPKMKSNRSPQIFLVGEPHTSFDHDPDNGLEHKKGF